MKITLETPIEDLRSVIEAEADRSSTEDRELGVADNEAEELMVYQGFINGAYWLWNQLKEQGK